MLIKQCSFVFLAVSVFGAPENGLKPRILGGSDVDIKNYPHQVSVEWMDMHICSGTIISNTFVITAAHCLDYKNIEDIDVRAGSSLMNDQDDSTLCRTKAFHIHPRYTTLLIDDALRYAFDLAILELAQPLPMEHDLIGAMDLLDANEVVPDGTDVAVLGWGTLSEGDQDYSKQLQKVMVRTVPLDDCKTDYEATVEMNGSLCAGETGKGFCQGDDGSPLIHDSKLFGIASWQIGCGQENKPGVYTSVTDQDTRDFISEVTQL